VVLNFRRRGVLENDEARPGPYATAQEHHRKMLPEQVKDAPRAPKIKSYLCKHT
jgi:hypothetical protein